MTSNTLFFSAFKKTIPVLTGYLAIGIPYGLLVAEAGYPFYLAPLSSILMFTGAGQYAAVPLFVNGAALLEFLALQFALALRHMAYGFSMHGLYKNAGAARPYLIYALTDETFALLSAVRGEDASPRFMLYVSALNQSYWVAGSLIGAVLGKALPWNLEGISFSVTALFIVLAVEQFRPIVKKLRHRTR